MRAEADGWVRRPRQHQRNAWEAGSTDRYPRGMRGTAGQTGRRPGPRAACLGRRGPHRPAPRPTTPAPPRRCLPRRPAAPEAEPEPAPRHDLSRWQPTRSPPGLRPPWVPARPRPRSPPGRSARPATTPRARIRRPAPDFQPSQPRVAPRDPVAPAAPAARRSYRGRAPAEMLPSVDRRPTADAALLRPCASAGCPTMTWSRPTQRVAAPRRAAQPHRQYEITDPAATTDVRQRPAGHYRS